MIRKELFGLIHHFQTGRLNFLYLQPAMYLANLAIHIIIYLSLKPIDFLNIDNFISNFAVLIFLGAFTIGVLLQLAFYMIKQKDFYLIVQITLFRFVVAPLLLLGLMQGVTTSTIPVNIGYCIFFSTQLCSIVVSCAFLFEVHRVYSLNVKETPIVYELANFEILLISYKFVTDQSTLHFFSLLLLLLALSTRGKHFFNIEDEGIEYKILSFINIMHIFMSIVVILELLVQSTDTHAYMIVLVPIVIYFVVQIFLRKRKISADLGKIIDNQADYAEFIREVEVFLALLKQDPTSVKRQLKNSLVSIISLHKKSCSMPNCELQTGSTLEEMKNLNTKNAKLLTHKVLKKIEWLFEQYHRKNADNIDITFSFLKLYAYYLPNRVKMQDLLAEVNLNALSWQHECELYQYRIICQAIQNVENIDAIKEDEDFVQFESALLSTLGCMIQFWFEFYEEKVDLNRIMQISAKLFPFKAKIEDISQKQMKIEKFSAFKILNLYSLYLKNILNKYDLSSKIQEYLIVLSQRLKDKQQIKFLSKESQAGFIVISLSESKLGNIFMVNQKACITFKHNKKDFLKLRVNAIMPTVFADIHDAILTDFLKTRRKKFNTDQRLLFGKDGNGYLFPVILQLQKASFSANDEYIFIACVWPEKTKSAPVYCIVDHDGQIKEYTASFKNIFFKSSKKSYNKNIQEIIPDYFDQGYNENERNVRYFTNIIKNNKLGEIQVNFEVMPIVVKTVHQGFLIKMNYNHEKTVSSYVNLNFTQTLRDSIEKEQVYGLQTNYNINSNSFQFEQGKPHIISLRNPHQQFTLPFLRYQDMAMFANQQKVKVYGKDIKIIRFVNNHYERVQDQSSFHSQVYQNDTKVDIKAKIEEIRMKFAKKEEKTLINSFKVGITIIIMLIMGALIYTNFIYAFETAEQKQILLQYDYQKQVKYYLPEYIIYFTLFNAGINTTYFEGKMTSLEAQLVNSLTNSNINEIQKEEIMKIVYLRSQKSLVQLLDSSTMNFNQNDSEVETMLFVSWSVTLALSFIMLIVEIIMLRSFKDILFRVYMIFLGMKQSSVRRIHDSCKAFMSKIHFQSQQKVEKEEEFKKQNQNGENEIEKIKQFKNVSRKQDKIYLAKMIFPLLLLMGSCLLVMFISNSAFRSYQTLKEYHISMFETIPSSSIQFMKIVLKVFEHSVIPLDSQYLDYYQGLEKVVNKFDAASGQSNFLNIFFGNVCSNSPAITQNMQQSCKFIGNGILSNGISPTINFIAQHLKKIDSSGNYSLSDLQNLLKLQFLFVNPVLVEVENRIQRILIQTVSQSNQIYSIIAITLIFMYLFYELYLVLYPLRSIETQINFTNGMINLMPENAGQQGEAKQRHSD